MPVPKITIGELYERYAEDTGNAFAEYGDALDFVYSEDLTKREARRQVREANRVVQSTDRPLKCGSLELGFGDALFTVLYDPARLKIVRGEGD